MAEKFNFEEALRRSIGEADLARLDANLHIWTVSSASPDGEGINNRVSNFVAQILDEFPYSFVACREGLDNWKQAGDNTWLVSADLTGENLYSLLWDEGWILYVSSRPLDIGFDPPVDKGRIATWMAERDLAVLVYLCQREERWFFAINPDSPLLQTHKTYQDNYLYSIYPDLIEFLGRWSEGLYRECFKDEYELAFWVTYGQDEAQRDAILKQSDRFLAEIPFPLDQIQVVANRQFKSLDDAKAWVKRILHECIVHMQNEDTEAHLWQTVSNAAKKHEIAFKKKGLRMPELRAVSRSAFKPYSSRLWFEIPRDSNSRSSKPPAEIDLVLCNNGEFRNSEDVSLEAEKKIGDFLVKYGMTRRNVLLITLAAVAVAIVFVLIVLAIANQP